MTMKKYRLEFIKELETLIDKKENYTKEFFPIHKKENLYKIINSKISKNTYMTYNFAKTRTPSNIPFDAAAMFNVSTIDKARALALDILNNEVASFAMIAEFDEKTTTVGNFRFVTRIDEAIFKTHVVVIRLSDKQNDDCNIKFGWPIKDKIPSTRILPHVFYPDIMSKLYQWMVIFPDSVCVMAQLCEDKLMQVNLLGDTFIALLKLHLDKAWIKQFRYNLKQAYPNLVNCVQTLQKQGYKVKPEDASAYL